MKEVCLRTRNTGKLESEKDTKALDEYLYVINLLLDCLQADSYVSRDLRDELIDYLLLPKESIPPHLLGKELSILSEEV